MKTQEVIAQIITKGIAHPVKLAGFKKVRFNFYRRLGSTIQMVNFQASTGNNSNNVRFYVNIGIAFDELWSLAGQEISENPKEWECHFRSRLEGLISDCPSRWDITLTTDLDVMATDLAQYIAIIINQLNIIDSAQTFINHPWRINNGDPTLGMRLFYINGDYDNTWQELVKISQKFADRQGMSVPALITRLRLDKMKDTLIDREADLRNLFISPMSAISLHYNDQRNLIRPC